MEILTKWECVSPSISKEFLEKTEFLVSNEEHKLLLEKIDEGLGLLINLNSSKNLKLQYHGRFESFLIGIGINPENKNQPHIKLVRIDTNVESSHNKQNSQFFEPERIKGPHLHWYNSIYPRLVSLEDIERGTINLQQYNESIKVFLGSISSCLDYTCIEAICPLQKVNELCRRQNKNRQEIREDIEISVVSKRKKSPRDILNQILDREFF